MSREFKFRAWHTELNRMIYFDFDDICNQGGLLCFFNKGTIFPKCENPSPADQDIIIMQYIGEDFKDENGQKLFEDDIVQLNFCGGREKIISVVSIENGEFKFITLLSCLRLRIIEFLHISKIIGNIHQNPELLPKENSND